MQNTFNYALQGLGDSVSLAKGKIGYCGPYKLVLDSNCCLSVAGTSLSLYGTQVTQYTTKLTITMAELPTVPSVVLSIPVSVTPSCFTTAIAFTTVPP